MKIMRTLVISLILMNVMLVSCFEKKPESPFSKVLDYCEMEEAKGDPYCDLGVHHKTLEEIMLMYGTPIEEVSGKIFSWIDFDDNSYLRTGKLDPHDPNIYIDGESKHIAMLFSNYKGGKLPQVIYYTWAPYEDKDTWVRIYFAKDELNQFRAIYGTKALKRVFFLE